MIYGVDGRYISDHFPGVGSYAYHLIAHLAELAPEDRFVVYADPVATNTRFRWDELLAHPNITRVPASAGIFSARQHVLMPSRVRRDGLSLFHAPHYALPLALPCPAVVTVHDLTPWILPEVLPQAGRRQVFKCWVRLAVRCAAHVMVSSEATRQDLIRLLGADERRVTVVPLGVDAHFAPRGQAEIEALRARLELAQPYLLYVGTQRPHKNLATLLRAWQALGAERRGDCILVIAGYEDPRYPEARHLAAELGLGAAVRFLGAVAHDDLPTLYSAALGFVFPSLYEGFGLPVLEAMACGTPAIVARSSALPEVAGEAALFFEPRDMAALADALACLLAEEDLRARLRQAGLVRARQFGWERTAARTLEIYRHVLAEKRGGA